MSLHVPIQAFAQTLSIAVRVLDHSKDYIQYFFRVFNFKKHEPIDTVSSVSARAYPGFWTVVRMDLC